MSPRRTIIATIVLFWVLSMTVGCSGGNNPSIPNAPNLAQTPASKSPREVPRFLWGFWQIQIDPKAGTGEAIPLRTAENHLNTIPFIESPGHSTMVLKDVNIDGAKVELNVGLTHPFPGLYQWSGFDVRGIFISDGSYDRFTSNGDLVMSDFDEPRLLNADGWTRWWNPEEFPMKGTILGYTDGLYGPKNAQVNFRNTLNPFKYFSDDLTQNEDFPSGLNLARRGIFLASTAVNFRHYSLDFGAPANEFIFNYAVDACHKFAPGYDGGTVPNLSQLPDPFFPIEANMPEAFAVEVDEILNTLYHQSPTELGGDLILSLKVHDWQGLRRTAGIPAEVKEIRVESPELLGSEIHLAELVEDGSQDYSTYNVELLGTHPDGLKYQEVLITVVSNEGDYKLGYDDFSTGFTGGQSEACAYMLYEPVISPEIPPQDEWIAVVSPNGGEVWQTGSAHDVMWSTSAGIPFVRIELSKNGTAGPFAVLPGGNDVANTGSWPWTPLIADITTHGIIKISDTADSLITDMSDAEFQVSPPDSITLTAPNGGEIWASGSTHDITWTWVGGFSQVLLEYSTAGADGPWFNVGGGDGKFGNSGSVSWNIPSSVASTDMYVRISDASDNVPTDKSDAAFAVENIQVVVPNGPSDSFQVGVAKNITWSVGTGTPNVVDHVKIEFSKNGTGGPFNVLPGGGNIPYSGGAGSWSWTPAAGDVTTHGIIRITDVNHSQLTDMSDNEFPVLVADSIALVIPNGGEVWVSGSTHDINWNWTGSFTQVLLEYSTSGLSGPWFNVGGGNGKFDNTGTASWIIPDAVASSNMYVRISDYFDGDPTDKSDAAFATEKITVLVPNGPADKFEINKAKNITWSTGSGTPNVIDHVKIELSKNGVSGPFNTIPGADNVPYTGGTGSWSWTPGSGDKTDHGIIRITDVNHAQLTDMSNAEFSVYEKPELTLTEYLSYFTGGSSTYKGRNIDLSGLNPTYYDGTVTNWDFTVTPLITYIGSGSPNFTMAKASGAGIGIHWGAPYWNSADYGMRPSIGESQAVRPWWVFRFNTTNSRLWPVGSDSYRDAELDPADCFMTFQYILMTERFSTSTTNQIQFPLYEDSADYPNLSGVGIIYYEERAWLTCEPTNASGPVDLITPGSNWTQLALGSVKASNNTTYPNCLLIRVRMDINDSSGSIDVLHHGQLLYQWVDCDTGNIIAFIMTHNEIEYINLPAYTNYSGNTIVGEGLIGARST